jgi:hypothetical protein
MTPIENLLGKLRDAKKAGNGWSARCPAHEDRRASLSIGKDDGTALVKCHAGCDTSAILAAVGLKLADLFPAKAGPTPNRIDAHGDAAEPKSMRAELDELAQAASTRDEVKIGASRGRSRPKIVVSTEEHEVNAEAEAALSGDDGLYQRGGSLVRVVRDDSPAAAGVRRKLAPRIEAIPREILRERLSAAATWVTIRETQDSVRELATHPPGWCVNAVHARGSWTSFRHLEAVVEYPILRPDGTILQAPGYDAATGLLLEPAGRIPKIKESPTQDDAIRARDRLLDVVVDFPFASPMYRAAWLAAFLTPIARFAYKGPSPLFLVDSNVRGAGKGLLLDAIALTITGERFTIATYTNDDELRKRITSIVLGGDRLVLFDNLDGKFGGPTLDAALTGVAWRDRMLGVNRMVEAPMVRDRQQRRDRRGHGPAHLPYPARIARGATGESARFPPRGPTGFSREESGGSIGRCPHHPAGVRRRRATGSRACALW